MKTRFLRAIAPCFALFFSVIASAATVEYRVLIDADNSTATGCPVTTPAVTEAGIDHVLITTVDTATNTVTKVERQQCSAGVLGARITVDAGGWSAGANADASGWKVETFLPTSVLGTPMPSAMHFYFIAVNGATATAVTSNANGSPVMWPPIVGRRHAVAPPEAGGGGPRSIVLDGDDHDWAGLAPLVGGSASFGNSALKYLDISAFGTNSRIFFLFRTQNQIGSSTPPTANPDTYSVKQGHNLAVVAPGVLANDTDPNGASLTAAVVSTPTAGTLNLNADGGFTYQNNGSSLPSDVFTYKANNGTADSAPATVTINVSPDNPPKAFADAYSVAHGGTLNVPAPGILGNDFDLDGDVMTALPNTPPAHGTLTLNANGSFKYVHDGSNTLTDSFTYKATDGIIPSTPATVSITVGPDAAPVAVNDAYTVAEGGTLNPGGVGVFANDTDADTPITSWTLNVVTQPAHGTLTPGPGGAFIYVHDGSETTSDSFTYQVNDGILLSNVATVSITVTTVNDAPVGVADAYTTNEDQTLTVAATGVLSNDTDAEGNSLTASVVTNPTKGTLTLNPNGGFQYVPNPNANGSDSFTYMATDNGTTNGSADPKSSAATTVTITITPVNDVPTFNAGGNVTVNEDSGAYSAAWATNMSAGPADESGQALNFIVSNNNNALFSAQPAINAAGQLTFTPAADANGSATVDVQLHDNGGTANGGVDTTVVVQFTITVNAVNDAPSFVKGLDQSVGEDAPQQTVNGWATSISKGPADEAGQTLNFLVTNDNNGLFSQQPVVSAAGQLQYTPAANVSGSATVTVRLHDDGGTLNGGVDTSAPQTFNIIVNAVNDAPAITRPATASTNEDTPLAFTAANTISVSDIDAGSGNLALTLSVSNGTLTLGTTTGLSPLTGNGTNLINATGNLTDLNAALATLSYSPSLNYSGSDTLVININDNGNTGSGGSLADNKTVAITVNAVNDAPVLTAGATLAYTENGSAAPIDTTITVNDVDNTNLASATVQITANYVNGEDVLAFVNTPNITGNFVAATGTLTLTGSDTLAAYQAALRSVTYVNTSDNPSTAPRTVTWTGNDGSVNSAPVTSTITITAVNDAPVVTAGGTLSYTENQAATAIDTTITITDSDSTTLTGATAQITGNYNNTEDLLSFANTPNITAAWTVATGTLTLSGTDTIANYQAALRAVMYHNTSDNPSAAARTVTWQVDDGAAANNLSNTPTSTINVTAVNDAPVLTAGATLSYTENQIATVVDNTITVADVDSTNLASATVQITGNYVNGEDVLAFTNTANITGNFVAATGTLTLTGSDTLAAYQAALRSVTYVNTSDNPSTASRTVTWTGNDGSVNSAGVTSTINVTAVNDAPVLTAGGTLSFTENQGPTAIDNTITITDVDSATLVGATVQFTAGYDIGVDVLAFTNTPNISATFLPAFGKLVLTGTDTVANYQAALRAVTFDTPSDNPSAAARTLTWQVDDGGAVANLSNTATSTVNVSPVNDAPVLTAGGSLTYTEADPASVIDNTITVADVDNTTLTGATVQITGNYQNGQDVLSFTNTANITGNFVAGTGTLTLTGTDTLAAYQSALRSVKYNNTSTSPSALQRTVTWIATDGTTPSAGVTSTITVISVNTAPTITAGATLGYTENQAATVIDNTITVTDPDTPTIVGATVTISANYVNGQDVLSFVNTANITGNFVAGTGTLTLTGTDTLAAYQTALRSVKYANTSDNPSTAARTVSWRVDDGDSSNNLSNIATSTINVTAVNDAPTLTVAANLSYTENDPATVVSSAATVTDPDNTTLTGGTVSITGNLNTAQDVLAATGNGTISASYNSGTGVLTLSGSDTLANYQTVLRSVTYQNTSDNPTPLTRTLTWVVTDGTTPSAPQATTINITAVNDAPVVTAGATLSYTENQAATVIDNTITVNDADNTNIASATVTISSNYVNGEDVLSFTNTPNITGNFVAATGILTLTGSDTLANYQAALRSVKYANSSDNPSTAARTISWQVNDGTSPSNTATSTVNVAAVNDAPVIVAGGPLNYTENQAPTAISTTLTVTDPDSANITGATAQITANYVNGEDILSFTNTANITGTFTAATGTMSLSGTDTVANYQAALRSIFYSNASENPSGAARTVTWIATDGITPSAGQTSTINVTPVNDPSVVTAGGTLNYTENDPATVIDNSITVSDVDTANLNFATVAIGTNYVNGEDVLSFTNTPNITGNFVAATGILTLTGSDTVANYQAALRTVKYTNSSNNPSTAPRTVNIQVRDASLVFSNTATATINVTSVNDAPVVTAGGTLNYTEDQVATAIDATLTVTDADSANLTGAVATISANYVNGQDILSFTNTVNITGVFNPAAGTMTLTGTDTVANYQAAMRAVKYNNTSQSPSTAPRTVQWQANDGQGVNNLSAIVTSTINVTSVNDAPVLTAGATLSYTENDPATVIDATITVNDVDSTTLTGATVQITGNYQNGQDVLSFATIGLITNGGFNAATGTLTLSGTDTLANYQAALRTVKYVNTSENPSALPRTITWIGNDGAGVNNLSAGVTSTVNVTPVNDPPVIANTSTLAYTENDAATSVNTAITVTDVDSTNLTSATVQITTNYVNGQDLLSFTNTPQITGSFNAATGTMTLTGSDTVANYQAALRNVKYTNNSDDPTTLARTVVFQVDDGGSPLHASNTINSTVNVTAVNDPPTAFAFANLPAQAGIAISYPAGKLGGSDLEAGTTITIDTTPINLVNINASQITINANGSFTITPTPASAGGTASFQYRVSDNGNPGPGVSGAYATVSFAVAGPAIYFVKNPAVGVGNCTLNNDCLLATAVTNIGANTNSHIFIGDANAHTNPATIALNSGGTIIGQGVTGFANFDALYSINGSPAQGTLAARPAIGQPKPSVNTTIALNTNSQARGFNMLPANNTSGITANNKAGLQVDLGTITTTTPGASATFAVDISGGSSGSLFNFGAIAANGNGASAKGVNFAATSTTTVTFSTISSVNNTALTVASSGATNFTFGNISTSGTGAGVNISTTTGNFTFGTVTTSSGAAVITSGTGAGTFSFGNVTATTGAGVSTSTSSGNFTFANVSTTTGAAVTVASSGAGTFSFNNVTATTGTSVSINTATGSFTFHQINNNGANKGIIVNSLTGTGSFTVTGTGGSGLCDSTHLAGTDCQGGTIQNVVARGAEFTTANNITLNNMYFHNAATTNGADPTVTPTTCGDIAAAGSSNTGCNASIYLSSIGGATVPGISMDKLYVDGSVQMGINGIDVAGFKLNNSTVQNAGNQANTVESGIMIKNLTGTSSMLNDTLQLDNAWPMRVVNASGSLTLTVDNVLFNGIGKANTTSQDGFLFQLAPGASGATVTVQNSRFRNNHAYGSQQTDDRTAAPASPLTVTFNNNDFGQTNGVAVSNANSNGIALTTSSFGQLDYTVNNNRLYGQDVVGIVLTESATSQSTSRISGTISNNTIGDPAVANSGAGTNGTGIQISGQGAGSVKANITGNNVSQVQNTGINIETMTNSSKGVFHITGNTVSPSATINNFGISVWAGNLAADTSNVCVELGGAGGLKNTINGIWSSNVAIRVRQRFGTTYNVSGYTGGNTDMTALQNYILGNNTITGVAQVVTASTTTAVVNSGATCASVTP